MNDKDALPTEGGGWFYGDLPKGCQLCMEGKKMVYYMGGDCAHPPRCAWYCPLSTERRSINAFFADEIPIKSPDNEDSVIKTLIQEAKTFDAKGMSLTGGDPLLTPSKVEHVAKIIKAMKAEFGNDFHVHLYTAGTNFDTWTADQLEEAGIDEVRFHPAEEDFKRLNFAADRKFDMGAEVPIIPNEENYAYVLKLAEYLDDIGGKFLNLNEFEMCEPNRNSLIAKGFQLAPGSIAAVDGSQKYAEKFLREFKPRGGLSVHFCSVEVKDSVQTMHRFLRRAEKMVRPYEEITEDGCLEFMRIEGTNKDLDELINTLQEDSGMPSNMMNRSVEGTKLDLPAVLEEQEDLMELLSQFPIKVGIMKITPFREEEVREICEYSPLQDTRPSRLAKRAKKSTKKME